MDAELLSFQVSRSNPAVTRDFPELRKITLKDFLENNDLLNRIQSKDKKLRSVMLAKDKLILPYAKNRPGETARWKMVVKNKVVVTKKNFGIRRTEVPVIPERLTNWIAQKIHDENGCTSLTV